MSFESYICWKPEYIYRVMDTEALQTEDYYFLATHYPAVMQRVQRGSIEGSGNAISEHDFLQEFLDPKRKHVNTVVLGSTGSGKSHLIRWLYNNIRQTKNRNIVLIPKAGTNLRDIIRALISGMKGPEFDEFRTKLETATASLTPTLARELLHKNLIVAIGPEGPFSKERIEDPREKEERDYIIGNLPALFSTPTFVRGLIKESGVLDHFSNRIVGKLGREWRDKPLEFSVDDLKLEEWNIRDQDLDSDARCIYADLKANVGFRQKVVDWLNKNIEWAVSRVLDLDSNDLGNLMFNLRETLAKQNKELIILMEDFSKSQGIDGQLLDALLVSPEQVGRTLCVLRWAIAVTTGYYNNRFEDTARERIDLLVNMDVPEDSKQQNNINKITHFAAQYLNAVRSEENSLREWHRNLQQSSGMETLPVPSACDQCPHCEICHSTFGVAEGLGLYPFTEEALDRMYCSVAKDQRLFNPRDLINEVLRNTLIHSGEAMKEKTFPPKTMLASFGGGRMPAINRQKLRDMVSETQFEQYRTIIELWGDPEQLSGISPEMFTAFGLKPLEMEARPTTKQKTIERKKEEPSTPGMLPQEIQNDLEELNKWANGGHLSQSLSERLRERLFEHIRAFIDWDTEMLVEAFYVGTSRAFQRMSINFKRQTTQVGRPQVRIELPLDDDFTSISLALQGMLLYEHHNNWYFEDGNRHFRSFVNCIEAVSEEIISQLQQLQTESIRWDPVPAATELLAIGARIRGESLAGVGGVENDVNALFLKWDEFSDEYQSWHSNNWQSLIKAYSDFGNNVANILISRIACTKGGTLAVQIIDTSAVIDTIEEIKKTWQLTNPLPGTIRDDYKDIGRLRNRVDQLLQKAIIEERQRYLEWYEKMQKHIAPGTSKKTVTGTVSTLMETAFNQGFLNKMQIEEIKRSISEFEDSDFDNVFKTIEKLKEFSDPLESLPLLGDRNNIRIMLIGDDFIKNINDLLALITHRMNTQKENLISDGNILDIQKTISTQLAELSKMTNNLAGGDPDVG